MRRVESNRQSRDDKRGDEPRTVREQQESASRRPKKPEGDNVTPSIEITPSPNHGPEQDTWQAVSCEGQTDAGVMQMIPERQQKAEPGEDAAVESSVAEDERHGTATPRSIQDNEIFANHLPKRTGRAVHTDDEASVLAYEDRAKAAHAGQRPEFISPPEERVQNGP
jgi:hypothetical protein